MGINIVIGWQEYETTFKGKKIKMEIRPLKRWASFILTPLFAKIEGLPNRKKKEKTIDYIKRLKPEQFEQMTEIFGKVQDASASIFKAHVRNIEGITINDKPVDFDIMAEESVFLQLCLELSGKLIEISSLSEGDEKN